jgi:uncharacterized protein YuzE
MVLLGAAPASTVEVAKGGRKLRRAGRVDRHRLPAEIHAVTVTIGTTTFDNVDYDAEADVLYLHVGDPSSAVGFDESPEGHALRFDAAGSLVGVTIVGARQLLDTGQPLVVTVPARLEVDAADLAGALTAA